MQVLTLQHLEGSDLTKFTSFARFAHCLKLYLVGGYLFSCGLESKTSGYGHSFYLLIWIVFTVQDKVIVNILHFCSVNTQVPEDLSSTFFPPIPWTSFVPACPVITHFFHSQNTKILQTHNWKHRKKLSGKRCNLCKWNLRSVFPFPYWLVFFSWGLLALGLLFGVSILASERAEWFQSLSQEKTNPNVSLTLIKTIKAMIMQK